MRKRNKLQIVVVIMSIMLLTVGASFSSNIPKLNIDKNPVYAKCNVAKVVGDADKDYAGTADRYKEEDIIACGTVKNLEEKQKSLTVLFDTREIKVTTDQKNEISKLSNGDSVTVYGKFKFESEKTKIVSIKADHILKESVTLSFDHYIYGGKGYDDSDSQTVSLADNRISYSIPNSWVSTEVAPEAYEKIFNETIVGDHTGKCYYINNINGAKEPEIFSVFYFNNNKFLDKSGDRVNTHEIEKAIITNICPKEDFKFYDPSKWIFPTEESTTSKGLHLDHYVGNYDNYRVEFVFTTVKGIDKNDSGGICVIMHLYNDDSIKPDDVLYVLSGLSVN